MFVIQESNNVPTSNAKKLYDKGLMQRKVALYLSEIVNLDEVGFIPGSVSQYSARLTNSLIIQFVITTFFFGKELNGFENNDLLICTSE